MVKQGEAPAAKIMHAHILLKCDKGEGGPRWSDQAIRAAFGIGGTLIKRVRKRFVENGLEDALNRRPQPERPDKQKIDGEQEAQLIALMCTQRPEGQERWTLRALTDRIIEVEIVESVSYETVRTVLKKRVEAVAQEAVVRGSHTRWQVCLSHGRRAGSLCPALRPQAATGVL